ncbi:MAG: ATP-binding protein [Pseudohongiella sp.]|nr:ATP-binding protein [Pseudohongiella sp.]
MNSMTLNLKGHRGETLLAVGVLIAAIYILCYSLLRTEWTGTPILCAIIIVLFTFKLIRLTERSNENFAQFINNISHDDFSSTTAHGSSEFSSHAFLQAQKVLLEKYRKLKVERSEQHEYLQLVIEHVDTALVCFDDAGKVTIINRAATELLRTRYISNLARIAAVSTELADALWAINAGERRIVKLKLGTESAQLLLAATEFRLIGSKQKLVSMQNIQSAFDEKEIESWQKLIRVLTHEIMNSMTPIVSVSCHLETVTTNGEFTEAGVLVDIDDHRDIVEGIASIASRSRGLLRFVEAYRSLSNLPKPTPTIINIEMLFTRLSVLLDGRFNSANIRFFHQVTPAQLTVQADNNLIEQILLNLLSNAIDAVREQEDRQIHLLAFQQESNGRVVIQVRDNGAGISKEHIDDIFTPFFTTKNEGTGVGLSLSRQLARLNNATLSVSSIEKKGSTFQLTFFGG